MNIIGEDDGNDITFNDLAEELLPGQEFYIDLNIENGCNLKYVLK